MPALFVADELMQRWVASLRTIRISLLPRHLFRSVLFFASDLAAHQQMTIFPGSFYRAVSFFAPSRPVFYNPINQGTFKTYVVASFLAFNPFVTKDLSAFGQKFFIKGRIAYPFCG